MKGTGQSPAAGRKRTSLSMLLPVSIPDLAWQEVSSQDLLHLTELERLTNRPDFGLTGLSGRNLLQEKIGS